MLAAAGLAVAIAAPAVAHAEGDHDHDLDSGPRLEGRAVLPVATYAKGPAAGAALVGGSTDPDGDGLINGIQFPTPSQPVEGFSGIVEGRRPGEYLAMTDNGFGSKANSADFNIRAYYLRPDFKTASGGSGRVDVKNYIEFSDPRHQFGFPIVNDDTHHRTFTGADIDPESIQRARNGDLWLGDEFGPWLLHFDAQGRLLEAPFELPDGLISPSHPDMPPVPPGAPLPPGVTVNNSRGIEAMAMTPDGRYLYVILEGAVIVGSPDPTSRRIYEFDLRRGEWTGRLAADYRTDVAGHFVADAQALDGHRLLVVERDGVAALVRKVYAIDLLDDPVGGFLPKTQVVDLAAIPDPDGVSLPAIHRGDVGLGDPFRVTCESIEALRIVSSRQLLLGCDNNFPNAGRNPARADDSELITVAVPGR
jgi:glycerophosphoryl diester phosphodiesterase